MTSNQTHWGKLYGSLCLHPKWLATPAEGRALWTSALSYCMVIGSDGDIPEAVLPMLNAPGADVATSVEHLLNSGLWVRTEKGYAFHDWSEHQQTVEERKSVRAKRSEAGKASAEARRRAKSEPGENASSTSDATSIEHVLSKRPTEKRREEKRREEEPSLPGVADAPEDGFDRFWKVYPKKVSKQAARRKWDALVKTVHPDEIVAGAEKYAAWIKAEGKSKQYTKDPAGWLNAGRWEDEIEVTTVSVKFDPWNPEAYSA